LATTPVTTDDDASPMRLAGVIEYIPLTSPSSPVSINIDSLIDLVGTVKERYLIESDKVAFVMHRTTAARLRKLKASTGGSYLWQESPQLGLPATLLGYRVVTVDAMPQVANDNFAVLFGNFARGYILMDRPQGMSIIADQVTTPGLTKFYISRRTGGCVLNNDAIKALRIAD
jgi:HK97 family phage major capsid protein